MTVQHKLVKTHRGFDIRVSESNWQFLVDSEDYVSPPNSNPWFASLKAAEEAIDNHIRAQAQLEIKAVNIAILVFDEQGETMTITGLHRGTGKAKVEGRRSSNEPHYAGHVYPAVGWVGDDVRRFRAIQEEAMAITKRLHPLGVKIGNSWQKNIAAEDYARHIKRLTEEIAKATKLAEGKIEEPAES